MTVIHQTGFVVKCVSTALMRQVHNKLGEAEIHFTEGDLAGLVILGIGVWENADGRRNISVPRNRWVSQDGEHRSQPVMIGHWESLAELVLHAFEEFERTERDEVTWR